MNAEEVGTDEVSIIFSFLPRNDILRARVCTTWRDAATTTLIPLTKFVVYGIRSHNALRVMSTALPNLQQLSIYDLGQGHKQKLTIVSCDYLKRDLEIMLARLPLLKELVCNGNPQVTGDRQHQQFESAQEYP